MKEDKIFTEDVNNVTFEDCIQYADCAGIDFVYIEKSLENHQPCPIRTYKGLVYQVLNRQIIEKIDSLIIKGKYRKALKVYGKIKKEHTGYGYLYGYLFKIYSLID